MSGNTIDMSSLSISVEQTSLDREIKTAEDKWFSKNMQIAKAFMDKTPSNKETWTLKEKCQARRIESHLEEYVVLFYDKTDSATLKEIVNILDFVQFDKWIHSSIF